MASWQDEYLAALEARDEVEKANMELYEAYTRVADRSAQLAAAASPAPPAPPPVDTASPPPPIVGRRGTTATSYPPSAPTESHVDLRTDLAKAQQERADLQARLNRMTKEVERLSSRSKVDNKRITQLTSELSQLSVRVRDRDEESRGKAKLFDNVQDEVVTLNLQLNMAEDEVKKVRKENQELVDRWMKRKGQEADRMNEDSSF